MVKDGNTPLHTAAASKPVKQVVVQTLLDAGTLIDTVHNPLLCTHCTVKSTWSL